MPAYTFRSAGSIPSTGGTLTPGAPAGRASGDLLLLATAARAPTETLVTPTGYTLILDTVGQPNATLALYGRIADGTATDLPSFDWSGSSNSTAQIVAFYGDVYTDLPTILAHSAITSSTSSGANIPTPALTITTDNCIVICLGKKQKTVTSDGAQSTQPTGINNEVADNWPAGSTVAMAWGYTQQTTASNISSGNITQSIAESLARASMVVALKTTASALDPIRLIWRK